MKTINETAEIIDNAIHALFKLQPDEAKPHVEVIIALIEHLRTRLDTIWFYPLGKMDSCIERLEGFTGVAKTGMSSEADLQFAFQDWNGAARNLKDVKELPRYAPTDSADLEG